MANTYTQIHIQCVFAVRNRRCLIHESWRQELYKYMTGIVQNYDHKLLQINGMPDHIHLFFGMRPTQSLSDLMKIVKGESSEWINKKRFLKEKFSWQAGFGGFSYTKDHVPQVIKYIQKQEVHHRKTSFLEEYTSLLKEFDVEFDERYIFKAIT